MPISNEALLPGGMSIRQRKAIPLVRRMVAMAAEKKDIGYLSLRARLYIMGLAAAAAVVAALSATSWQAGQTSHFLFLLICGTLCSNMKVNIPGVTGTLSVNYIFILASVTELSPPHTIIIGTISGLAQLYLGARQRPRAVQAGFTCASLVLSCASTHVVYNAGFLPGSIPVRLFCASVAYFLLNSGSVAGIIALTEGKTFARVWRENFFWTAPHYLVGGSIAGLIRYCDLWFGWQSSLLVFPTIYLVYHSYQLYLRRLEEEKRHVGEVADLHLRTIHALALAIDARDGTTHGHLRRVQVYARELARELGLSEEERRALNAAALLHDIGKLAVPEYIISKPGRLTPEEFEKMKVHPIVGAEILESVQFPYPVVPIVRAHHEKWDGTGYPFGLNGDQIPLGARIVAAVDCLDALASDRQYRRALPLDEAMQRVIEESGRSFDPRVVDVLARRYRELETLARKQTDGGSSPLSTGIRVERGGPATGLDRSVGTGGGHRGFIAQIAAAREEFQALLELSNELGCSLRIDETLSLLALRLRALVPYHGIAIYIAQGPTLRTQYASGEDAALFSSLEIPLGEGISGWVTQNNKPIVNGSPSVEPGYLADPARFSIHRSALSVPLPGTQGVIGALTLYHRESGAFTRDHLRILLAVSTKAGRTIENALRFVSAEKSATTDALTGLPNARSLFLRLEQEIERAGEARSRVAVAVADIDGFKQVNDQYGHTAGNRILGQTGQALREVTRDAGYAARMGGDEFVLIWAALDSRSIQDRVAELQLLVAEAGVGACPGEALGLSVGVAFYPEDGVNAEELLARADGRMYEMKAQHHSNPDSARSLNRMASALEALSTPSRVDEVRNRR